MADWKPSDLGQMLRPICREDGDRPVADVFLLCSTDIVYVYCQHVQLQELADAKINKALAKVRAIGIAGSLRQNAVSHEYEVSEAAQ